MIANSSEKARRDCWMAGEKIGSFSLHPAYPPWRANRQLSLHRSRLLPCSLLRKQFRCLAVAVSGLLGGLRLTFLGFLKSRLSSGADLNGVFRGAAWCHCGLRRSL